MKIELNRDQIKYIAVFTMLLNHVANIFLQATKWKHISQMKLVLNVHILNTAIQNSENVPAWSCYPALP